MSYHDQAHNINLMVKAYGMTPDQVNIMIKFAKIVRRSARQNTVLWNIVRESIEGTPMRLETQRVTNDRGESYEDWKVVGEPQPAEGGDALE
jgi:hypothetical protein